MDALVTMTGNVGSDIEYRVVNGQWSYATFRLASTPRVRRNGEWKDGETTWISVSCSRALADNVQLSLSKGEPVIAVGKLRTQRWLDGHNAEQSRLVLEATTVAHDLCRGRTSFSRSERQAEIGDVGPLGPMIQATEQDGGEFKSANAMAA